ncbi:MAG TPA: hypothetical protein DGN60_07225 [Chloroflexi bacterium]|nr:hypothetical protein [Chloroflexota bacterium]
MNWCDHIFSIFITVVLFFMCLMHGFGAVLFSRLLQ